MYFTYRTATHNDIDEVLTLHARYQVDTIDEKDKKDGFITTAFNQTQLTDIIEKENGLFLAISNNRIVGYAMAACWQYWSQWPMFAHMVKELPNLQYKGYVLSVDNSYQYGPICVDQSVRGSGVFEALFYYALEKMSVKYSVLVTFINKINQRSFAAHTKKVNLDVLQEFEYNNNHYYELVCLTNSRLDKMVK